MSAFELYNGFSFPATAKPIDTLVTDNISDARDQLQARRSLAVILCSKPATEVPLTVGDMIIKRENIRKVANVQIPNYSCLSTNQHAKGAPQVLRKAHVPKAQRHKGREITVACVDTGKLVHICYIRALIRYYKM